MLPASISYRLGSPFFITSIKIFVFHVSSAAKVAYYSHILSILYSLIFFFVVFISQGRLIFPVFISSMSTGLSTSSMVILFMFFFFFFKFKHAFVSIQNSISRVGKIWLKWMLIWFKFQDGAKKYTNLETPIYPILSRYSFLSICLSQY